MRYAKSPAGQAAFSQRSPLLTARQRTAFILFDGKRSFDEVLESTGGIGVSATDLQHLIQLGFLTAVSDPTTPTAPAQSPLSEVGNESDASKQQRYQVAYPLAIQLTATLGLRGFRLNLAIEAAGSHDDLVKLFPKIAEAVGAEKSRPLALALGL